MDNVPADAISLANLNGITGPMILHPKRIKDERGYFEEAYNRASIAKCGVECDFVQDNLVLSKSAGTLRGLHLQSPPHAQAKLVRCITGAILDVAVDLRTSSKTYGHWMSVELSAEDGRQLFVPEGFAHGYITLTDDCTVLYKVNRHYHPVSELGINPLCETLGIDWGAPPAVMSEKDKKLPIFPDFDTPFYG